MELYLYKVQFQKLIRYFKRNPFAKIITTVLFLLVFLGLGWGIYNFFYRGFSYINETSPFLASALSLYLYELFLLAVMLLFWIGGVAVVLFSLFKDKDSYWFLAAPKFQIIPQLIFFRTVFSSGWVMLVVLLPASLAIMQFSGKSVWQFFVPLMASLVFAAGLIALVFVVTFLLGRLLAILHRRLMNFKFILLLWVLFISSCLTLVAKRIAGSDLIKLVYAQDLTITRAPLTLVEDLFSIFPTHYLAKVYLFAQTGEALKMWWWFFLIIAGSVFLYGLFRLTSKTWFLPVWQALAESQTELLTPGKHKMARTSLLNSPLGVVVYKEALSFMRNSRSLFWFLFIVLLWFSHIGIQIYLQKIILRYELTDTQLPLLSSVLPLLVLAYFTASLVLRFAFPAFSEEKNTAWIFFSSPLTKTSLVLGKFLYYLIVFGLVALVAESLVVMVSILPQSFASLILSLALVMTFFLTAFGVALGTLFPNFETSDSEKLSTSLPGLSLVVIAIAYGALASFLLYRFSASQSLLELWLFGVLSILLGILSLVWAIRKSKKQELITPLA